jgi:hypothetical protein
VNPAAPPTIILRPSFAAAVIRERGGLCSIKRVSRGVIENVKQASAGNR